MKKLVRNCTLLFACCLLIHTLMRGRYESFVSLLERFFTQNLSMLGKKKIILIYTTFGTELYWKGLEAEKLSSHLDTVGCDTTKCTITYDRNQIEAASAVLFHAQDMYTDQAYSPKTLLDIRRSRMQRWIWVNQESPVNLKNVEEYNAFFNWTATYHRASDIFLPYFYYSLLQKSLNHSKFLHMLQGILQKKTKLIAWFVSHCGGIREKYVLELQKFIDVTVYGECKNRFKLPGPLCMRESKECLEELNKYKFYLSFENSICEDYVTEKYWKNALMSDCVPIVMGSNYDSVVAIPGSYIDILKFDSIKQLALFIDYLDKNDDQYFRYFEWRKKYEVHKTEDLICSICKKLQKDNHSRSYKHLDKFWNEKRSCSSQSRAMNILKRQIANSKIVTD